MRKIIKGIGNFIKKIYDFFDKYLVTPISKFVYRIITNFNKKTGGLEKLLNRPNVLFYLSLVLAVVVFLLTDSKVISLVENEAEVITNIPLTVRYNEEAYVVEGIPEEVDVILTGRKSDIYLAKQLGDHEVILDLSDYEASSNPYKVYLTYTKSVESLSYKLDPSYVTVTIKDRISKLSDVTYDLINSTKLDSKLNVKNVELSKNELVVKGSEDTLNKIASVKALIDLNNESFTEAGTFNVDNIPVVAYDEKGKILDSITIVPGTLSATITLDSYSENVPLSVLTTGNLVTGKAIASILINNSSSFSMDIYGDKEKISDIKNVPVTINVDGQGNTGTKTYNVTISKPNGVRHMTASTATITVTFGEEKQKTIEITDVKYRNKIEGYSANAYGTDKVSVQVKGVQSVIDSIEPDSITAYVDLAGLTNGEYELDVKFESVDPKVKLVALNKMTIKVSKD